MKYQLKRLLVKPNVFIVSLFAVVAYIVSALSISWSTLQYSSLPDTVQLNVRDSRYPAGSTNQSKTFVLKVRSRLPVDSIESANRAMGMCLAPTAGAPVIHNLLYHQTPVFLVWFILICIMISTAAGSFPVFISLIISLGSEFTLTNRHYRKAIGYAMFLILFLMFTNGSIHGYYDPPSIIDDFNILFSSPNVPVYIVLSVILLLSPVFVLIFLAGLATTTVDERQSQTEGIELAVKKLNSLNKYLQSALQLLAVIVVFSVLTSGALGETIRSTVRVDGFNLYPKEISFVYGLYFSLFLCIIYIPVYFFIKQKYISVKETAFNLKVGETEAHAKWYNKNFGQTKFESSALDNLKLALTVLSPLLSAFVPSTLGLIK